MRTILDLHRLDDDPEAGRRQILEKIGGFQGSRDDVLALIRACLAIGRADSDFSARERSAVEEICRQAGTQFDPKVVAAFLVAVGRDPEHKPTQRDLDLFDDVAGRSA